MKEPKEVIAARAALDAKNKEYEAAEEATKMILFEVQEAGHALRKALIDADTNLPRCELVLVDRGTPRKGTEPVVILRKTPSGILVVKKLGDDNGKTFKFVWSKIKGAYCQAERREFYGQSVRELRNVPAAFLPTNEGGK